EGPIRIEAELAVRRVAHQPNLQGQTVGVSEWREDALVGRLAQSFSRTDGVEGDRARPRQMPVEGIARLVEADAGPAGRETALAIALGPDLCRAGRQEAMVARVLGVGGLVRPQGLDPVAVVVAEFQILRLGQVGDLSALPVRELAAVRVPAPS